jgi:chemotaxis response regulator CheB
VAVDALIIDDSGEARTIIRRHLAQIGCKVVGEADNAAPGVKFFRERNPKIVMLDLIPAVEGIDAMAAFHIMRKNSPAPQSWW